ncbi:unnamed protein product, partial [Ixodes hexagonus]
MGTFTGHVLPGTFLFLLGTWWTFGAWRVYILGRLRRRSYLYTASFALPKLPKRLCVEGLGKVLCASIGTAGELATAYYDGHFAAMGNAQHISMYVFYGLSGLTDLLTVHGAPLPVGTDHCILLMAVCVEGFLFHFHLHGRTHLDVLIHTLLVYTIVAEAVCIAIEMARRKSALAALGRAYFGVVQGTWFFQVGFILYNPLPGAQKWVENHHNMMLATAIYTWHLMGALVYVGVLGVVAWLWCARCEGVGKNRD